MNGCHTDLVPDRNQHEKVFHSNGKTSWDYNFTRECQYSKQSIVDDGCNNCKNNAKLILG
jgi:hypothetical protein